MAFKCCGTHAALMRADALFNTNSLQQPRVVSSARQHRNALRAQHELRLCAARASPLSSSAPTHAPPLQLRYTRLHSARPFRPHGGVPQVRRDGLRRRPRGGAGRCASLARTHPIQHVALTPRPLRCDARRVAQGVPGVRAVRLQAQPRGARPAARQGRRAVLQALRGGRASSSARAAAQSVAAARGGHAGVGRRHGSGRHRQARRAVRGDRRRRRRSGRTSAGCASCACA